MSRSQDVDRQPRPALLVGPRGGFEPRGNKVREGQPVALASPPARVRGGCVPREGDAASRERVLSPSRRPSIFAATPPVAAGEGTGKEFQPGSLTKLPRGYSRQWCLPCNGMRDHLRGVCAMDWWHR